MARTLVLTDLALRDLRDIHACIAADSPANADAFLADLTARIEWIAEDGFTGVPRDHISVGLRAFPYRRRCIYFRHEQTRTLILRVVHGAQDVEQLQF